VGEMDRAFSKHGEKRNSHTLVGKEKEKEKDV
jgi:hypothetical protein